MRRMLIGSMMVALSGCVTTGSNPINDTRSFGLNNGSKIVFDRHGCTPRNAKFINAGDTNVKHVSGSIIGFKDNENETIEEYMLSCSPAVAGGSSPCSLYKMRGRGGADEYGGIGCPDIRFRLMNIQAY